MVLDAVTKDRLRQQVRYACMASGSATAIALRRRSRLLTPALLPLSHCLRPQIEFYFSDSNLPRDKFLQEKVAADADGYVDLALLAIFQRVRSLLKSTVMEPEKVSEQTVVDVADALEGSDSLALSEDRKRVRRATALKDSQEVRGGSGGGALAAGCWVLVLSSGALSACQCRTGCHVQQQLGNRRAQCFWHAGHTLLGSFLAWPCVSSAWLCSLGCYTE